MSMIKIENLTFSYPSNGENIFENASAQIDTDWRLGFVGRNGRGKTTLLKLLTGEYEYSGRIISSVSFDYFPYPVKDKNLFTADILKDVCPESPEWKITRELLAIGADEEILRRPFCTLSNGEQTKALLCALFLKEGHFPLIDEPTNHLDIYAREKVAQYLKKKNGFMLVSHDRRFLDGCIDHVLSLNRADIEVRSGNFSSFLEDFTKRQESETARNEHLKRDISRLKSSAKRAENWSEKTEASKAGAGDKGYVGHKAAKMMKRAKAIEARQQKAIEEKSHLLKNAEKAEALKLFPLNYRAERLVSLKDVSIYYGEKKACGPLSFDIKRKERIALDGANGSGKSSVLKLVAGEKLCLKGRIETGSGLVISYVPQDTSFLNGSLAGFAEKNGIDSTLFLTILRKMDFSRAQFEKDMSQLSGGQKKKALIAKSLCEKAHLYIWDEPLNFIDIFSRMQIERLIAEFSPTMLFVEHDAAFRENTATRVIRI